MTLDAKSRGRLTGAELNRLRREGYIPATISIRGEETRHCSVSRDKLAAILKSHGQSAIIELQSEDGLSRALVISRDVQLDHLGDKMVHVGFQGVSASVDITAEVRVSLIGRPEEVRTGACRVEQVAPTVLVRGRPDMLPAQIDLDVSDMVMGSVLRVADLDTSHVWEVVSPPDTVVVVLHSMTRVAPQPEETADLQAGATG
jgi:large subunit ribosomal protein L25